MHARAVVRDVVRLAQEREEVVGREDRVTGRLNETLFAEGAHVGVSAHEDAEVPEALLDRADRLADGVGLAVLPRGVVVVGAIGLADDPRLRQERPEGRLDAERARPGTARAMGRRERLVDVDVHAVEAEIAGARDPEERVHVRAVAVHEPADVVYRGADLAHALFEEADGVRVREHEACDVRSERRLQRVEVDVPACVAFHRGDLVPAHRGRCRVRAVRRVRDDDATPLSSLAAFRVVRLEHEERGELGLRARLRLKADEVHAADLREELLELVREREHALRRAVRLTWVDIREEPGDAIVDLRVVLHRARAEWVHARVHGVVQLREVRVVAHHLRLGELRQPERRRPPESRRDVGRFGRAHVPAVAAGPGELEEQGLEGGQRRLRAEVRDGLRADRHRAATASPARDGLAIASTSASSSASVVSSVHCTMTSSRPRRRPST